MTQIQLGKNGPWVPGLCFGTWAWGDRVFWRYGEDYGASQVREAFTTVVEAGVAFFDTAEVYGNGLSEKLLGQFMQTTPQPVQIATKYGPMPWRWTAQSVEEALTASLERLQQSQVTLYQVHWPFKFLMSEKTLMSALAAQVQQGRIQAVGVSNYSAVQMREAADILASYGIPLAVNQVRYSLITRKIESRGILQTAKELGVTILAYSPLAQGLLTGKYQGNTPPKGPRQWDRRFGEQGGKELVPVLELLGCLADHYEKTLAQVALNWLICQGNVIPIAGVKTAAQVRDNLGALGWSLQPQEIEALERVTQPWL